MVMASVRYEGYLLLQLTYTTRIKDIYGLLRHKDFF